MRFMVQAVIPAAEANAAIKAGTFVKNIQAMLEMIKPESVYFTAVDGNRTAIMFVDIPDASHIPSIGEPLFLGFNAHVTFAPVMTPEDLMAAAPAFESAVRAFA